METMGPRGFKYLEKNYNGDQILFSQQERLSSTAYAVKNETAN